MYSYCNSVISTAPKKLKITNNSKEPVIMKSSMFYYTIIEGLHQNLTDLISHASQMPKLPRLQRAEDVAKAEEFPHAVLSILQDMALTREEDHRKLNQQVAAMNSLAKHFKINTIKLSGLDKIALVGG